MKLYDNMMLCISFLFCREGGFKVTETDKNT